MAITESQLDTWSNQGATVTAQQTHESIRAALNAKSSPIRDMNVDVYLQGSYRNATNIYGDSDVDVVVQLNDVFIYDTSLLPVESQITLAQSITPATYDWKTYRRDVVTALSEWYGATAVDTTGNKSIKLPRANGRLQADVVPCFEHRRITTLTMAGTYNYFSGICLYTSREHREVINYPKMHVENGQSKNARERTNGWYKPTVRMFKNIRSTLVEQRMIRRENAPSYFVECLLYNVPDTCFGGDYQHTFCNVINWLNDNLNDQFLCQNRRVELFGPSPEQWDLVNARAFITAAIELWNRW